MAIDYVVDYSCVPKDTLGTDGIVLRLKGRARAEAIIRLFRESGDERPPSAMGFEMARSTPAGDEETRVFVVQDLLDEAAALDPLESYCVGCPANAAGRPFGCINFVQYPLSARGESWLLRQLPMPTATLVWLLLRETVTEMGYMGASVAPLRGNGIYFENATAPSRMLGELHVNADQAFEMLFMLGHVEPAQAGALLLFFGGLRRDVERDDIALILNRGLPPELLRARFPFLHAPEAAEDNTTAELKEFLHALYYGWSLNTRVLLDV